MSNSLWPRGLQRARLPCPPLSPRVCSNSCPLSGWCPPAISSSVTSFSSCPQSFPAPGSFPKYCIFSSSISPNSLIRVVELQRKLSSQLWQIWYKIGTQLGKQGIMNLGMGPVGSVIKDLEFLYPLDLAELTEVAHTPLLKSGASLSALQNNMYSSQDLSSLPLLTTRPISRVNLQCYLTREVSVQFSSVQSLSCVWLLETPQITAHQASLSITNSRRSFRLTSIESVMPFSISSSVFLFSSCP